MRSPGGVLLAVAVVSLTLFAVPAHAQSAGLTISTAAVTATEAGTTGSFTVALVTQPTGTVTLSAVNSATTQVSVSPLYLTFTANNWNNPQTVTLTATDDTAADGDTTATITMSVLDATSDSAYHEVADATVNLTVIDDDFCGLAILESNGSTGVTEAATTDTFTVALGAQPTNNVVVSVTSGDAGEVTVNPAQLTYTNANWSTTQTVTVTGVDDTTGDGNQTPVVTLTIVDASSDDCFDPSADSTVTVRVSDDDSAGLTVVETGGSIEVTEAATTSTATTSGSTDTFTVVLNKEPTGNVVIRVTSDDVGEIAVNPAELTYTNANWSTTQTVTVTGINDSEIDGTQITTVTLSVIDASSNDAYDPVADHTI
ncbi:uncharacterized protein METZ01_LOCUS185341, partial [marine metagenome]